jgi:1-acyl-sn-glycerol-3-phosphate acyltransferase
MVVANHVSEIDTLLIARLVWQSGRIPRFMVKAQVLSWPVVGRIVRGAGQIPVHRGTTDAANSLREAAGALDRGEAVVIYPEGTTTKDPANWPMQGKTGVARLILMRPDVPVVPVGQWGAHRSSLATGRLVRRRTSLASVGEPLDLSRFRGKEPTAEILREITDEVMTAVREEVAQLRGEPAPAEFFLPKRRHVDGR